MSEHEKDGLMDCLFSGQDTRLRNIKFFRGSQDLISEEDFRAELKGSINRRRAHDSLKTEPPKTKKAPIDLRQFVADM